MKGNIGPLLLYVLVFAISRIPGMLWADLANFSGVYALAFCAGVYFSRRAAWWVPMCAMLISDIALNMYYWLHKGWNVWQLPVLRYQLVIYIALALIILLGRRFKPQSSFLALLGGGLMGALLFYFITNTASWFFNPFGNPEYSKDLMGLLTALIKGTGGWPETWQFFRNTMFSSGLFTALFVGVMKYSTAESAQEKEAGARTDEPEGEETPEEAKG